MAAIQQATLDQRHMTCEEYKRCALVNHPLLQLDKINNGLVAKTKQTGQYAALLKQEEYFKRADAMRQRLARKRAQQKTTANITE